MVNVINTNLLDPQMLSHCGDELAKLVLSEFSSLFKAVGVCPDSVRRTIDGPVGSGNKIMIPDTYLKETSGSLSTIYNALLKVFPSVVKHSPLLAEPFVACLSAGVCTKPSLACTSLLKVVEHLPNNCRDLLGLLEMLILHHYAMHARDERTNGKQLAKAVGRSSTASKTSDHGSSNNADSDSAFYASDSSASLLDQNVEEKRLPSQLEHLAPYTRLILKRDTNLSALMEHIATLLNKTNWQGRLEAFVGVVCPVLEIELDLNYDGDNETENSVLLWSLQCSRSLLEDSETIEFLCHQPERLSRLTVSLLNVCSTQTLGCINSSAVQCLKLLAISDLARLDQTKIKASLEDGFATTSDEESLPRVCIPLSLILRYSTRIVCSLRIFKSLFKVF